MAKPMGRADENGKQIVERLKKRRFPMNRRRFFGPFSGICSEIARRRKVIAKPMGRADENGPQIVERLKKPGFPVNLRTFFGAVFARICSELVRRQKVAAKPRGRAREKGRPIVERLKCKFWFKNRMLENFNLQFSRFFSKNYQFQAKIEKSDQNDRQEARFSTRNRPDAQKTPENPKNSRAALRDCKVPIFVCFFFLLVFGFFFFARPDRRSPE